MLCDEILNVQQQILFEIINEILPKRLRRKSVSGEVIKRNQN